MNERDPNQVMNAVLGDIIGPLVRQVSGATAEAATMREHITSLSATVAELREQVTQALNPEGEAAKPDSATADPGPAAADG